jgi:hypothetical protein
MKKGSVDVAFTEAMKVNERPVDRRRIPRFIPSPVEKKGFFNIDLSGEIVGSVDVNKVNHVTYVTVTLLDTFLTIEQFSNLMENLRENFNLSQDQKVSIQQL